MPAESRYGMLWLLLGTTASYCITADGLAFFHVPMEHATFVYIYIYICIVLTGMICVHIHIYTQCLQI